MANSYTNSGVDERLMAAQNAAELRAGKMNEGREAEAESGPPASPTYAIREALRKSRQKEALQTAAKAKTTLLGAGSRKATSYIGKCLLELIPGYSGYTILNRAVVGSTTRLGWSRIFIMIFYNSTWIFTALGVAAVMVVVVHFITADWLEKLKMVIVGLVNLSWEALSALKDLFSSTM